MFPVFPVLSQSVPSFRQIDSSCSLCSPFPPLAPLTQFPVSASRTPGTLGTAGTRRQWRGLRIGCRETDVERGGTDGAINATVALRYLSLAFLKTEGSAESSPSVAGYHHR
jgi:hypothetical protein